MDKQKLMYSILACFLLTFFTWGSGNTFWFGKEIVIIFWGGSNDTPPWSMQPQPWFALYYYCFCWCSLGTMLRSFFILNRAVCSVMLRLSSRCLWVPIWMVLLKLTPFFYNWNIIDFKKSREFKFFSTPTTHGRAFSDGWFSSLIFLWEWMRI